MIPETLLYYAAAAVSAALAVLVLWRDRGAFANRIFAPGMLLLAGRELAEGLAADSVAPTEVLDWQILSLTIGSLIPGLWLSFSLTYARANQREFLNKWRWTLVATFVLPVLLVSVFRSSLLREPQLTEDSHWVLALGWAGYVLYVLFLLSSVLILLNLENTLRASTGTMRWHIKFLLLGVGAIFAVEIYMSSQALLFASVNSALVPVSSVTLLVASALSLVSFWRSRLVHVEVYLSQTFVYNSLTVLIVGIYLLVVGFLAQAVAERGGSQSLPLAALLVFVALLALVTALLSDGVRQSFRRFVTRHLKRPHYDYRNVWSRFTDRTRAGLDIQELCAAMARLVSETLGTPSVSIWLLNETRDGLVLGGSTALSQPKGASVVAPEGRSGRLIDAMKDQSLPVDLKERLDNRFRDAAQMRYCVNLVAGQELVGFLTLDEKVGGKELSTEDFTLLKTIADQAASTLLNVRLSERLLHAKELEAFQTLSAFFIHDLKNLASRLSLSLQNLPNHYDNPEFRSDLLKTISQSVEKINSMCGRLSPLSRELELHPEETDLNDLVAQTLETLNGETRAHLEQDLNPVPRLRLDSEQIQKVLVNLVLNANEATGGNGSIRITTRKRNDWTEITVSDDGPGMSREFVERFLFKPFHTTKKQGLGIGLFHSKKIVDAHEGRIEVETQEGEGCTFRVLFPNS